MSSDAPSRTWAGLHVTTRHLDTDRGLLDLVPAGAEPTAWTRADTHRGSDEGLVGWGRAATIEPGAGSGRFSAAMDALRRLADGAVVDDEIGASGSGLVALGSFTFDDDADGSVMIVPRRIVGRRDGVTWLTTIDAAHGGLEPVPGPADTGRHDPTPGPPRDRPRYAGATRPDVDWLEAVAAALDHIRSGTVAKVVLARDLAVWSRSPFDATDLARRLQRHFPSCHTFVVDGLIGATPELLIARDGRHVTSRVLAGTTGRDADTLRDDALGAALLASDKDRREHRLAVESVVDVLGAKCAELDVDAEPWLLKLENVQHLATEIEGRLRGDATSLALAGALHPTAAVGGTPRQAALTLLRRLEGIDRGRYAAPVGWTDPAGDGEWGIALRCAQLAGTTARLFAGVGIVDGSLPEAELAETRLKLLAMQAVLGEATPAG